MAQLLGVLEQGLIYAVLALGVYITFKILDFPDMTVDSTFPLGAAVTALMISNGIHPLLTLPASLLAGAAAGALTGVIHVKFHVRDLLSGIIMMTGLYLQSTCISPAARTCSCSPSIHCLKTTLFPVCQQAYSPMPRLS